MPYGMDVLDYLQGRSPGGGASKPTKPAAPTISPWEGPFKNFQTQLKDQNETERLNRQHRQLTEEIMRNLGGVIEPGGQEAWWKWAAERAWAMLLGQRWPEEKIPSGSVMGPIDARDPKESPLAHEQRRQMWYAGAKGYKPEGGGK